MTYIVIDALVDATFPTLDQLDDMVDELEDQIIAAARPEVLNQIYHSKHSVTELRKFLAAQRDVFQQLITHKRDGRLPIDGIQPGQRALASLITGPRRCRG